MGGEKGVKPDPTVWLPLLEDYRLTSLPGHTVLRGRLREGFGPESPEVRSALAAWPAQAYLDHDESGTDLLVVYHLREEPRRRMWVHAALLLATLVTTMGSGALMRGVDPFATRAFAIGSVSLPYPSGLIWPRLLLGATFALPFLTVLVTHEMGHFWAARSHGVRASLPYFIPFPPYFSVIGSLGAFIRLRGPTVRRFVLFDIGASGPLASFLVSAPLFAIGLRLSHVVPGTASLASPFVIRFAGQPVFLGNGLATELLGSLFAPGPIGEGLIHLHPLALAGWLGLFVTALNLLPLGQLDGGHVLYAMFPQRHATVARLFLLSLLPLGFLWWGWWGWAGLVLFLHRGRVAHPRVVMPEARLDRVRALLGWILIVTFLVTLTPVPIAL